MQEVAWVRAGDHCQDVQRAPEDALHARDDEQAGALPHAQAAATAAGAGAAWSRRR